MDGRRRYDYSVRLVNYDESVEDEHRRLAATIRCALGSHLRCLEPIGSRLIPGVLSKPTHDLMALVDDPVATGLHLLLEPIGFVEIEDHDLPRRIFRLVEGDTPAAHLHLVSAEYWPQARERAFHALIKNNSDMAMMYSEAKQLLCRYVGSDPQAYGAHKDVFVRWLEGLQEVAVVD